MSGKVNPNKVLEEARNNVELRDTCTQHKFNPDEYAFATPMRCLNCGCKVPLHYINPYISGFVAAGGDANDVWQDWQESPQRRSARGQP